MRSRSLSRRGSYRAVFTNRSGPVPLNAAAASRSSRSRGKLIAALITLITGVGVAAWLWVSTRPVRSPSIAVIPLENLSTDAEQEFFSDGITDALFTDLAKIHGLSVISRTSVMRYKRTKKTISEIARELKVDYVVEGTVTRVRATGCASRLS